MDNSRIAKWAVLGGKPRRMAGLRENIQEDIATPWAGTPRVDVYDNMVRAVSEELGGSCGPGGIAPCIDPRQFAEDSEREASYKFKDFDDPWKAMSPEDHREANRLFKAVMRAFPSSPKQLALKAKLDALLSKYGIGKKASEDIAGRIAGLTTPQTGKRQPEKGVDDSEPFDEPTCRRPAPTMPGLSGYPRQAFLELEMVRLAVIEEGPGCCRTDMTTRRNMKKYYKQNRKQELKERKKERRTVRPETRERPGGRTHEKRKVYRRRDYPNVIVQPEKGDLHEVRKVNVVKPRPSPKGRWKDVKPTQNVKVINNP